MSTSSSSSSSRLVQTRVARRRRKSHLELLTTTATSSPPPSSSPTRLSTSHSAFYCVLFSTSSRRVMKPSRVAAFNLLAICLIILSSCSSSFVFAAVGDENSTQIIDNCTFDLVDPGMDPCFWIREESPDSEGKCIGFDTSNSAESSSSSSSSSKSSKDSDKFTGWTEWSSGVYFPSSMSADGAIAPSSSSSSSGDSSADSLVRCPIAFVSNDRRDDAAAINASLSTANMTDDESKIVYGKDYTIMQSTNCLFWPLDDHTGNKMQYQYAILRSGAANRARLIFNCQNYVLNVSMIGNEACLSFWYYLEPNHVGAHLMVNQKTSRRGGSGCYSQLFSTETARSVVYGRWAQAKVRIPMMRSGGQLYFEAAKVSNQFALDGIGLDDIIVQDIDQCDIPADAAVTYTSQTPACIDYLAPRDAITFDSRIIRDACNVDNASSCANWKPLGDQFRPWRSNSSILNAGDRVLARCWSKVQLESCVLWPEKDHSSLGAGGADEGGVGMYYLSLFKANVSVTPHVLMLARPDLLEIDSILVAKRVLCLTFWYVIEPNHETALSVVVSYENPTKTSVNETLWLVTNGTGTWTLGQVELSLSRQKIKSVSISASKANTRWLFDGLSLDDIFLFETEACPTMPPMARVKGQLLTTAAPSTAVTNGADMVPRHLNDLFDNSFTKTTVVESSSSSSSSSTTTSKATSTSTTTSPTTAKPSSTATPTITRSKTATTVTDNYYDRMGMLAETSTVSSSKAATKTATSSSPSTTAAVTTTATSSAPSSTTEKVISAAATETDLFGGWIDESESTTSTLAPTTTTTEQTTTTTTTTTPRTTTKPTTTKATTTTSKTTITTTAKLRAATTTTPWDDEIPTTTMAAKTTTRRTSTTSKTTPTTTTTTAPSTSSSTSTTTARTTTSKSTPPTTTTTTAFVMLVTAQTSRAYWSTKRPDNGGNSTEKLSIVSGSDNSLPPDSLPMAVVVGASVGGGLALLVILGFFIWLSIHCSRSRGGPHSGRNASFSKRVYKPASAVTSSLAPAVYVQPSFPSSPSTYQQHSGLASANRVLVTNINGSLVQTNGTLSRGMNGVTANGNGNHLNHNQNNNNNNTALDVTFYSNLPKSIADRTPAWREVARPQRPRLLPAGVEERHEGGLKNHAQQLLFGKQYNNNNNGNGNIINNGNNNSRPLPPLAASSVVNGTSIALLQPNGHVTLSQNRFATMDPRVPSTFSVGNGIHPDDRLNNFKWQSEQQQKALMMNGRAAAAGAGVGNNPSIVVQMADRFQASNNNVQKSSSPLRSFGPSVKNGNIIINENEEDTAVDSWSMIANNNNTKNINSFLNGTRNNNNSYVNGNGNATNGSISNGVMVNGVGVGGKQQPPQQFRHLNPTDNNNNSGRQYQRSSNGGGSGGSGDHSDGSFNGSSDALLSSYNNQTGAMTTTTSINSSSVDTSATITTAPMPPPSRNGSDIFKSTAF